jgi:hypothetical protein
MSPYNVLWPLFEPCSEPQALRLPYSVLVRMQNAGGSYDLPLDLVLCLCPTPTMDVLMLIAGLGVVLVFGLVIWLLASAVTVPPSLPSPQMQTQQIVETVLQEVDQLSEEFLRRI